MSRTSTSGKHTHFHIRLNTHTHKHFHSRLNTHLHSHFHSRLNAYTRINTCACTKPKFLLPHLDTHT
jgi:hypothetical protein